MAHAERLKTVDNADVAASPLPRLRLLLRRGKQAFNFIPVPVFLPHALPHCRLNPI